MRYETVKIRRDLNGVRHYASSMVPNIPIKDTDIFVYPLYGDRLDTIANRHYGDSNLWWIIAKANNLDKAEIGLNVEKQIRIPTDIQPILNKLRAMSY